MKGMAVWFGAVAVVYAAVVISIACVALHFIVKFW